MRITKDVGILESRSKTAVGLKSLWKVARVAPARVALWFHRLNLSSIPRYWIDCIVTSLRSGAPVVTCRGRRDVLSRTFWFLLFNGYGRLFCWYTLFSEIVIHGQSGTFFGGCWAYLHKFLILTFSQPSTVCRCFSCFSYFGHFLVLCYFRLWCLFKMLFVVGSTACRWSIFFSSCMYRIIFGLDSLEIHNMRCNVML